MKINISSLAGGYKPDISQKSKSKLPVGDKFQPSNTDKIDFVSTLDNKRGDFSAIVKSISSQTFRSDNSDKIDDIKQSIENGDYSVSSHDIADAILGRFKF